MHTASKLWLIISQQWSSKGGQHVCLSKLANLLFVAWLTFGVLDVATDPQGRQMADPDMWGTGRGSGHSLSHVAIVTLLHIFGHRGYDLTSWETCMQTQVVCLLNDAKFKPV